jgi:prevent-host-death family protein
VKTVNIHEAKTHLSRLIERVRAGEEIVIAKNGEPCARLLPIGAAPTGRKPGTLKGLVEVTDAFFEPLPAGWHGEE